MSAATLGSLGRRATEEEEEEAAAAAHMRKCYHVEIPRLLILNPVVAISSVLLLWALVILCVVTPDYALQTMNVAAFEWVPEVWTWFYIVSQDVWLVVLLYIMVVSKYGGLKLGKDDEEPAYSFQTWFAMLFSAGVAVGLFYYSVAEPVWHYKGSGRFTRDSRGYGNDNEDSMHAIMVTWYHWGLHGWIPYTTLGAVLAITSFRRGFPMTIRYCLYPLLGDKVYGLLGDMVDSLSIITTIAGVCTSLGLGAMQLNQGLQRLNHGFYRGTNYAIPDEPRYAAPACGGTGQTCADGLEAYGIQVNVGTQIVIIVVITCVATLSVVSGLDWGIANLSRVNFALGMFLVLTVLFLGETYFILDTLVQTFGYYCWYLLKIGFYTDAFERLGDKELGLGGAPDDVSGSDSWLSGWTLFYWGWWISWGPFCGTFLAKISRGRTLRQFIMGTLIVPTLYSFFWFGVFGAEGIRMQRMADASGVCNGTSAYSATYSDSYKQSQGMGWTPDCVLDPNYHEGYGRCEKRAWTRKVVVGEECVESTSWVSVPCGGTADPTALSPWAFGNLSTSGPCAGQVTESMFDLYPLGSESRPDCFVPAQAGIVCLNSVGTTDMLFDQLASYGPRDSRGFSDLLSVLAIAALVMYFVTSSDSGSMVVDMISANGHGHPPLPQRIFWSFTEGATAIALLYAGKNQENSNGSLKALQSASMVAGLPYTFILFWCAQSLYLLVREESGEISADRKAFDTFILSFQHPCRLLHNTLCPGWAMGQIVRQVGGWPLSWASGSMAGTVWCVAFQGLFQTAIVLLFCTPALYQWCILGLVSYIGFAALLAFLRATVRAKLHILHGDLLTDFLCAVFLPMFTVTQMQEQLERKEPQKESPLQAPGDAGAGARESKEPDVDPEQPGPASNAADDGPPQTIVM